MGLGNTLNDYKNAFLALLPTGSCWPRDDASNLVKLVTGMVAEFHRVDGRVVDLYAEAFPDSANELIENWETMVGLPDAFSPENPSLQQRRNAALFKLRARGGQSAGYYEDLIEALGYEAIIYEQMVSDVSSAGDYVLGEEWLNVFLVSVFGAVVNQETLEARINSVKPAHTLAVFYYNPTDGTAAEIEDLIDDFGYTALVFEAAEVTVGIAIAGGFIFDSSWSDWFLVVVENPVADQAAFEAAILAVQPNTVFHYVDDISDY